MSVTSITSSFSVQMRALTSVVPSLGIFIAILPFDITFTKSDSALRRTVPIEVASMICISPQRSSGTSTGMIAAMLTPGLIGSTLTSALPLEVRPPSGSRSVFIL